MYYVLRVSHTVLSVITHLRVITQATWIAEMQLNVTHVLVLHLVLIAQMILILVLILRVRRKTVFYFAMNLKTQTTLFARLIPMVFVTILPLHHFVRIKLVMKAVG